MRNNENKKESMNLQADTIYTVTNFKKDINILIESFCKLSHRLIGTPSTLNGQKQYTATITLYNGPDVDCIVIIRTCGETLNIMIMNNNTQINNKITKFLFNKEKE